MNRLKKLFADQSSSFAINLLAYWDNQIFPSHMSATPHHHQPLLNDQQHEYDDLLLDVELAGADSDVQSGSESNDEEAEHLAHKSQHPTSLSSDEPRNNTPESGEGDGSDDGEQVLDNSGEEGESEAYESRGGE
jgi:hypothetical protein